MNKAIGVFDSGIGGLTIVKQLNILLPNETIIYFGDNKRLPYGSLSNATIIKYTKQNINFLLSKNIKLIIAACGTVSSILLNQEKNFKINLPILNIIEPICTAAIKATKNFNIGIIGTMSTINNSIISNKIYNLNNKIKIFSQACPLLVPNIENQLYYNEPDIIKKILLKYLLPLKIKKIDTLILGCTHYPILLELINDIMGNNVTIIDPSILMAKYTFDFLKNKFLFSKIINSKIQNSFFISGDNITFDNFASEFFKKKINSKNININQY